MQKQLSLLAYNHTHLNSRLIHPYEEQVYQGPFMITDKETRALKDRFGVLCATRLLLFKSQNFKEKALAVYPIINAEFKMTQTANKVSNGSFGPQVCQLEMVFYEQAHHRESKPRGPTQSRIFYFQSIQLCQEWLNHFQQTNFTLKTNLLQNQQRSKLRESQALRTSETNFIQKVVREFASYFNCTGICGGSAVRQSLHEIYLDTQNGVITPMVFESYQTQTAEIYSKEFTFREKKNTSLLLTNNPFTVKESPEELLTKVTLSKYQNETEEAEREEGYKSGNFGAKLELKEEVKINTSAEPVRFKMQRDESYKSNNMDISPNNIVRQDLTQLVGTIFEEEYDPNRIKKLCQQRESRRTFDFTAQNLNIGTGCPGRIFEALEAYATSQSPNSNQSPFAKENLQSSPSVAESTVNPSNVAKAKLIMSIHEVEDIFVAYAEDTIERVIDQIKLQTSKGISKIEVKRSFQISVSLLLNDIQSFANLYRAFRDTHFEFFDLEEQQSQIAHSPGDVDEEEVFVPVVPSLSSAFYMLQLIDEYRQTGQKSLLEELIAENKERENSVILKSSSAKKQKY